MVEINVYAENNVNIYRTKQWDNAEECIKDLQYASYEDYPLYFKDDGDKSVLLKPAHIREIVVYNVHEERIG